MRVPRLVILATDQRATTTRIAHLLRDEFPDTQILARAYDRAHAIELVKLGVDHQLRETFESALALSREALVMLDVPDDEADETIDGVRKRDRERFALQVSGDIYAGSSLLIGNAKDQASGR
ncbi:MAG: NAD-binding protein [Rhodobacteraceae bacterium]|nr:NAD-binding protein [Paracoccaceae bacterium]